MARGEGSSRLRRDPRAAGRAVDLGRRGLCGAGSFGERREDAQVDRGLEDRGGDLVRVFPEPSAFRETSRETCNRKQRDKLGLSPP